MTLSLKYNDYCIAAYDASNNEIIRLVKDTSRENGIPKAYASNINLLDEVSIKILGDSPKEHQTENVLIDLEYGLKPTGEKGDIRTIYNCLPECISVFGDCEYKLNNISNLDHSLEIIKFKNMVIRKNDYNKPKVDFECGIERHLSYSITDPGFYDKETKIDSGYVVVSLPASDDFTEQKGYYKYVSAIYPD